jgi:hypothetical protein
MNVPSGNDQRRDVKKIPGDKSGKIPRGPGPGVGRSLMGQESEVGKFHKGIKKKIRKNPPEDFRQGEFPMKEMSLVRDSMQE